MISSTKEKYNFNISLSVLNHLGRNLYRNIITVLGEAISNSWDADARNVWIDIDKDKNSMRIKDDGVGMSEADFQDKFLKIGYSKRKNGKFTSDNGRPFIGRKGIGKLAMLSCAKRIHIITKAAEGEVVGGIIDNTGLDKAIKDDLNSQDYELETLTVTDNNSFSASDNGTIIFFESVSDGIYNTIEYIKNAIALYFRFSLLDSSFSIYVNNEIIDEDLLKNLADCTQFVWRINNFNDKLLISMSNLEECIYMKSDINISGYIATAKKPSNLKIRGTQEKATLDLFVNGRLREKDILRHMPTSRIVENYVYGQIHYNDLDSGGSRDIFTSSREGVISDDPSFVEMLKEVERLFRKLTDDWDDMRRKHGDDGDPDNKKITKKSRKAQELFNTTLKDMESDSKFITKNSLVEQWVKQLAEESQFNIPSYTECFISENLLRKFVQHSGLEISPEAKREAETWRARESQNKANANISFNIRASSDDLYYLDMKSLSNLVDKAEDIKSLGLSRSAVTYKPVRDAVGHTSLITDVAKNQLSIEYENIKVRLITLLKELGKGKS